ncbi:MAG: LamG domain-containing protein [Candidatus Wallbacteria bacterium]|nr:LamG domain-containing protein [Candidatus Wallbacteria bacterium]
MRKGFSMLDAIVTMAVTLGVMLVFAYQARPGLFRTERVLLAHTLASIRDALEDFARSKGRYPLHLNELCGENLGSVKYFAQIPLDPTTDSDNWQLLKGSSNTPSWHSGLVAWYPFREGIGNITADYTGGLSANMRDCSWINGPEDLAVRLDGVSSYIYILDASTDLNPVFDSAFSERTVCLWYNCQDDPDPPQQVNFLYEEGDSNNGMNIYIRNNGNIYGGAWSGGAGQWIGAPYAPNSGWHHIACVYDSVSNLIRLYHDGGLTGSAAMAATVGGHPSQSILGCLYKTSRTNTGAIGPAAPVDYYFEGMLDEVRVYNRALSAAEISELYNGSTMPSWISRADEFTDSREILSVRSAHPEYQDL